MLMCRFGNDCAPTISDRKVSLPRSFSRTLFSLPSS
ncbi:Uncharacterised protein [Mycobacteroides abscessus subsp. abscessus]|nr:Uncharacterised protein [Mycobacteroides abscessus subsp. abscessus]